tara:strand:+ start:2489 stop:2905 length:417 start_codon:yes stop_codon:yes gene_type:complete
MPITSVHFSTASNGSDKASFSPDQNPQINADTDTVYDGITLRKTLGGKSFAVANHQTKRRRRKLIYENISSTSKDRLEGLFNQVKGRLNSFFYSEDGFASNGADSDNNFEVRFVKDVLPISETAFNVFTVEIEIEEQI